MTDVAAGHPLVQRLLAHGRERQPLVGAHRGDAAHAPENTPAAFRAALDAGADLLELDIHLTRDGRLAVIHDATTRRTTGTDNVVAAMTMAQLGDLDAGSYKGMEWSGERIPELGDVFALARGRLLVNVEVKGGATAVPVLAHRIAEHGMEESVIVSSFDTTTLRAARDLDDGLLIGLLLDRLPRDLTATTRDAGAALLHVQHSLLSRHLVDDAHGAGMPVVAWTVNDAREMRRLAALGVDAVLSDDPRRLRETIMMVHRA